MSFVLLGILNSQAAGAGQAYFLSVLGGLSSEIGRGISFDSNGSIYIVGQTSQGAGTNYFLGKYAQNGTVDWQRTFGGGGDDLGRAITVDASDDIYIQGRTESTGQGGEDFAIAKYNSSGTILWQRVLGGAFRDRGLSIASDSANNIYAFGFTSSTVSFRQEFLIVKYNSSGTIQWQRSLGSSAENYGYGIAVDGSDDIYVCGEHRTGAGVADFILAKYNSSGTIQWQRLLGGSGFQRALAIATDSANNVYITGRTDSVGAGSSDNLLAKYNSSGTLQWQRVLGGASQDVCQAITIDSADNVYISGHTDSTGAGNDDFLIAKYNSSGSIQWQRVLGGTDNDESFGIAVDSDDNIYAFGFAEGVRIAGIDDFFLAKLPNDGSLTGTYSLAGSSITYQSSSLTAASGTLSDSAASETSGSISLVGATSTLTNTTVNLTVTTEEIG